MTFSHAQPGSATKTFEPNYFSTISPSILWERCKLVHWEVWKIDSAWVGVCLYLKTEVSHPWQEMKSRVKYTWGGIWHYDVGIRRSVIPTISDISSTETYRAGGELSDHLLQPLILDEETEAHRSEFPSSDAIKAFPLHEDMVGGMSVLHHYSIHHLEYQWLPMVVLHYFSQSRQLGWIGYPSWEVWVLCLFCTKITQLHSLLS